MKAVRACEWWNELAFQEGWVRGWPSEFESWGVSSFESTGGARAEAPETAENPGVVPRSVAPAHYVAGEGAAMQASQLPKYGVLKPFACSNPDCQAPRALSILNERIFPPTTNQREGRRGAWRGVCTSDHSQATANFRPKEQSPKVVRSAAYSICSQPKSLRLLAIHSAHTRPSTSACADLVDQSQACSRWRVKFLAFGEIGLVCVQSSMTVPATSLMS